MAVTRAEFSLRFPSFDGVDPGVVETQLADAAARLDRDAFPNEVVYDRAAFLMAAHNMTVQGLGQGVEASVAAGGVALDAVQSVSDGGLSISLRSAQGRGADSPFNGSQYGRELLHILRNSTTRIATIGMTKEVRGHARGSPYTRRYL